MAHQRLSRSLIGKVVFIVIVVVIGYALAASGNLSNPFNVVSEVANLVSEDSESTAPGGQFQTEGARPAESSGMPPQGGAEGGGEQTSLQWNAAGGVLFNLWYLAATAALVMVVGGLVGWVLKPLRGGRRMMLAAITKP